MSTLLYTHIPRGFFAYKNGSCFRNTILQRY